MIAIVSRSIDVAEQGATEHRGSDHQVLQLDDRRHIGLEEGSAR